MEGPWWRILLAGVGAGVLTLLLQRLTIFGYVYGHLFFTGEVPVGERLDLFAYLAAHWVTLALHILLTLLAAFWVARGARKAPILYGISVGAVSAVSNQLIILVLFPPLLPAEMAEYLVLGMISGALGGHLARSVVAGRESLYRTSRAIGSAQDPDGVAAAIGEHLTSSETREVGLWGVSSQSDLGGHATAFVLLGSWRPERSRKETLGATLDSIRVPQLKGLRAGSAMTVRLRNLPAPEYSAWAKAGVGSVLFVPLVVPGERLVGLLSVASRSRFGPSRVVTRSYLTVGAQAALALENSRLTEEGRRMGRQAGVMRERQRLAHEIHDTLAQGFISVVTNARAAEAALPEDPESVRLHHGHIVRAASEGLSEARRMVQTLRPEPLEDASLPEALAALAKRWSDESHVPVTANVVGIPHPLTSETETTLLRVVQETLSNVRKHAHANRVALTLSYMTDHVSLDARDDGVGFDHVAMPSPGGSLDGGGFGLSTMRERMTLLGGTLVVESAPGEGTNITAELPTASKVETSIVRKRNGSEAGEQTR